MNENEAISSGSPPRRQPWNKGKLIGAKPPLRASHVWSIRTKLQLEGRTRDLALFNLAIDSRRLPADQSSKRASCGHRAPPSARMCKRCSLLTRCPGTMPKCHYFNGGSAAISTGWAPPIPWRRGCGCDSLKLNYWEESHA